MFISPHTTMVERGYWAIMNCNCCSKSSKSVDFWRAVVTGTLYADATSTDRPLPRCTCTQTISKFEPFMSVNGVGSSSDRKLSRTSIATPPFPLGKLS